MLTLLATLLVASPAPDTARAAIATPPPIQITLNNGGSYYPGGMVSVRVETADDGYLLVFRVDGDGRIRVVFPLDPDADAFVRGGKEYELRGRGDRSTFQADDRGGSGMVYAALSRTPFVVRDFSQNGHWDYDMLRLRDSSMDAESDLTAIVTQMTNRARFDYDAVGYRVQEIAGTAAAGAPGGYYPGLYDPYYNPRWRCMSCGWGYPGSQFSVGFGYSPFWDPWLYSPWGYNYGYYGYGYGFGYGNGWNNWYPVAVNPRPVPVLPPGTRSRPRPGAPPSSGTNVSAPPPVRTVPSAPPASSGTRARPRPSDYTPTRGAADERPVFRQPPQPQPTGQGAPRNEPQQSRPVYRDPPQVYRAPPPSAPPVSRAPPPPPPSSSAPRSSPPPPPPPPPRSRPGGGGRN